MDLHNFIQENRTATIVIGGALFIGGILTAGTSSVLGLTMIAGGLATSGTGIFIDQIPAHKLDFSAVSEPLASANTHVAEAKPTSRPALAQAENIETPRTPPSSRPTTREIS